MTPHRLLVPFLVLAPLACVASTSAPAPAVSTKADCTALSQAAASRVETAIGAHKSCSADADCVTVGAAAGCFDHCSRAIAGSGTAALTAVIADVDAQECHEFEAKGCVTEVPPCMAPKTPACVQGTCE
jgi:hypothetical protein